VGHAAGELSDGFEFLRLLKLKLAGAKRFFGALAFRDVSRAALDCHRHSVLIDQSAAHFDRNAATIFSDSFDFIDCQGVVRELHLQSCVNLVEVAARYYIGNSHSDVQIFSSARYSYLVNPTFLVKTKAKKNSEVKQIWNLKKGSFKSYLKAIRVYQWVKNLLIFVPLITSHSFFSIKPLTLAVMAFVSFSLVASAGYLINDLLDLNADRIHPRKRFRPLASGKISILHGIVLSIVLLTAGFYLASRLNHLFWIIVLFYFFTSLSYSVFLKRIVLYDVFVLAVLYSTRVFAGGVATSILLSSWLIAFSTFIFLSLAFVKRYSELFQVDDNDSLEKRGRGYFVEDIHLLQTMGVVSGFLSVVVFSLYLDSPDVSLLYSNPRILWITSLLFLFWVSRMWMLTVRGKMTDDPIIFTLKDWISYLIFCLVGLCILFAMYSPSS